MNTARLGLYAIAATLFLGACAPGAGDDFTCEESGTETPPLGTTYPTISSDQVCDGTEDCPNGEDEAEEACGSADAGS